MTFLFTDIAGSTRLWEERPDEMRALVAQHDARFRSVVEAHDGYVVKGTGDGLHAAFGRAADAVAAASEARAAIADLPNIRVRMGINTGEAQERDGDYFGSAVNRTARLMAAGHGGQVLLAAVTVDLVPDLVVRCLGEHRLRDLGNPMVIWQLGTEEFPPLRSLDARSTNLPVQLTTFVGRDEQVNAVAELLAEHRLVTLTGVGGVGKTRLATQAAADAVDRFGDGVWLVELAPIDAPRVIDAIARVLGVEISRDAAVDASLLDFVRTRALLLVLDNCEHVVREVRKIADALLRTAPGVSILATSREALRVDGEHLFSIPSLDDHAALQLFVERAQAADASFALDDSGERVVEELCARLDGVPLAIELAAARARMFSIGELARRVDQRFRLLTGGRGDIERHQTLRAAIDWSYDLLEDLERVAFARFSVFAGGGTLEAIESVVGDDEELADVIVDIVSGLVDKSLVLADRTHAESRYEMLETIRQYAQEKLVQSGDAERVRERHAHWYAAFARSAGRGLYSADELEWDERLRLEVDNLQVAVAWAVGAGETDVAMRIGGSFPRQATARPLLGTVYLAEVALGVVGADQHPARARVLAEAAWAAVRRGDMSLALDRLHQSVAAQRAGARFAAAAFMYLLTLAGRDDASSDGRLEMVEEGLALAEASGDKVAETGLRIAYASTLALVSPRTELAEQQARRALDDARALRQPTLETAALYSLAQTTFRSDPEGAITLLRTSIDMGRRHHSESEEGAALGLLAYVEAKHGDARGAVLALREATVWKIRNVAASWAPFYLGTGAFSRVGRHDLVAFCEGNTFPGGGQLWHGLHNDEIAVARAALGDDAFDQIVARAAELPPDEFNMRLLHEIDAILVQMGDAQ